MNRNNKKDDKKRNEFTMCGMKTTCYTAGRLFGAPSVFGWVVVATNRQAGWALYEDAAEVMAEECGRHPESRCVTPFLLKLTTLP